MDRVDVAIVGGGPAGTSAAWAAAREGADALVVEKGVPRADRDRIGPDSTDAAGMLDYWVDIMDVSPEEIPDDVILSVLDGAEFIGPNESVTLEQTGIDASYDHFGFAFHRAKFDDWLRDRAEEAGGTYHVGTSVNGVETDLSGDPRHTLTLADGDEIGADYLILADGPQRTVTTDALDQFLPGGQSVSDYLGPSQANHIAYQEHRRIPEELFDPAHIKFWWGVIPGHTAYPWIFPNDDNVARVGLTMPMGMDLADVENPEDYALLDADDERIPAGAVYLRRLLEREYPGYDLDDFPLVEDRGKSAGTEAYPISSTRPIDSPVNAGIAVVGGAMGATSAFHEGGDHVAVRTGKIAGELAANDQLGRYNGRWKSAIGEEVLRNVTFADVVRGWEPDDWDEVFAATRQMQRKGGYDWVGALRSGATALRIVADYKWTKRGYRDGAYVQIRQDEYSI
ncbi:NAD(P)/FAD-dependent oxidoreductase [Halosimplex salinum]|uniref:NAD(P)/FAD-dependent oxidoreductase n=1 Tax=Halosimplex salinum TaxID=1710538 RepID=UPI000F4AF502|nr:NAD(P)/FAD-dependent oxidoreductase [Halosimplex salinum]